MSFPKGLDMTAEEIQKLDIESMTKSRIVAMSFCEPRS